MKKKLAKLLICASVMVMVLSLGACGDDESDNKSNSGSNSNVQNDKDSGKYGSIKEYVESDEFQEMFEAMLAANQSDEMTMAVSGEDNKLIYTYTYTETYEGEGLELMKEYFEEAMADESMVAQFESLAAQLPLYINVTNPVVVVEYLNGDGSVIYSAEFSK